MSESRRSGPRVPSPWWVLLPGVLLALAGARAVTSEAERARAEARDTARVAAEHVARAFGTLVDEYVAPLPGPDEAIDVTEIDEVTRHLVRPFAIRADGVWIETRDVDAAAEAVHERDRAVAADVIASAADEALGAADAAALLSAAAATMDARSVRAELLARAADLDLRAGYPVAALADLRAVLDDPPATDAPEETLRPFAAALDALPQVVPAAYAAADCDFLWLVDALAWAHRAGLRVDIDGILGPLPPDPMGDSVDIVFALPRKQVEPLLAQIDVARALAAEAPARPIARRFGDALLVARTTRVRRDPGDVAALVGGELPGPTLSERVNAEIRALADDRGAAVVLRAPDGAHVLSGGGNGPRADGPERVVVVADVTGAALGWSVEAAVPRPTGLPTSALVLAFGVGVSVVVLGLGAFVLARAARHHARLAEERRSFLDHVAHEVRTPAASLLALSEELQRGHVEAERVGTYHEHLARESRRLADLVEETLDLARLEGGRLVAKREPLDLREVVLGAVDSARAEPDRVRIDLPDDEVSVDGDRAALRRAIRNLVDNALKHGAADEPVQVRLGVEGEWAVLAVRDHGKGIPHGHVDRVFERFHRVPSATHDVKGVGLGLALVAEVASAHDGAASAENAAGGGARFSLRLRLRRPEGGEA